MSGVVVEFGGEIALHFGADGRLSSYKIDDRLEEGIEETKSGIKKLLTNNAIYFAHPGEKVEVRNLILMGKPFYLEIDQRGSKRLHRAYVD